MFVHWFHGLSAFVFVAVLGSYKEDYLKFEIVSIWLYGGCGELESRNHGGRLSLLKLTTLSRSAIAV